MTENTATAPTAAPVPMPSPERIANAIEVLRFHMAYLTQHEEKINPGGALCPAITPEQAKAGYDGSSSRERRRHYRTLVDLYHGHVEISQASVRASLIAIDAALNFLLPEADPEPEAGQPANDAATPAGAGE